MSIYLPIAVNRRFVEEARVSEPAAVGIESRGKKGEVVLRSPRDHLRDARSRARAALRAAHPEQIHSPATAP